MQIVQLSEEVESVDRGLVVLPHRTDSPPTPAHPAFQPAEADAAGAVGIRGYGKVPSLQGQKSLQRFEGNVGCNGFPKMNIEEMQVFNGLSR